VEEQPLKQRSGIGVGSNRQSANGNRSTAWLLWLGEMAGEQQASRRVVSCEKKARYGWQFGLASASSFCGWNLTFILALWVEREDLTCLM